MHRHVELFKDRRAFGEDVVEKDDEDMLDLGPCGAQRIAEVRLAAAIRGHVLDQQDALPGGQMSFDLRVAAETLGLLAHVLHRQHQPVGDHGGERNARRLTAGDGVETLEPDVALDGRNGEVDQGPTDPGEGDQLAAIDVDGAGPARGENERLGGVEVDGLHLEQHFRGEFGNQSPFGEGAKSGHSRHPCWLNTLAGSGAGAPPSSRASDGNGSSINRGPPATLWFRRPGRSAPVHRVLPPPSPRAPSTRRARA